VRTHAGRRAGLAAALLAVALPGQAAEPRSAIPWLSQSIELDDTRPPPSRAAAARRSADPDAITVTPLGAVRRDAVGLLPPSETGFARALWGPDSTLRVRQAIEAYPGQGVPAAQALFRRLLLAEADPPPGPTGDTSLLVARIDRLLAIGALEPARALIERAGPDTPELFRRWFDIGVLLDDAEEPCAALRQNPSLSPTLPARVFCLARGGDWNAAEITLTLGEEVGSIPEPEQALLARFLDPVLFEEEEAPPIPEPLTALDFLMREAVGLPRPPGPLPLAFLHTDLVEHAPMRSRIEAAERLTLAGAVEPDVLLDAYRSGVPAASGGVWDRARAVQALDAALAEGGDAPWEALAAADTALTSRGLRVAFAQGYGAELAALDPIAAPPEARVGLAELLLLAGETEAARRAAGRAPEPRLAVLLAFAEGSPPPPDVEDPRAAAALAGLTADEPADERETRLAGMVAAGRQGQAILAALELLQAGPGVDPPALRAALLTLRLAGQEASARQIAVETLLLGSG
jgi:hypothetical protein